mgnify:FL=1
MEDVELLVIGGGIVGAGIFRRASQLGLKTLLLERGAAGAQTTGSSTGLFHGGLRYLPYDASTSVLCSRETGHLLRCYPTLLRRQAFLWPIYSGDPHGMDRVEALLEYYDLLAPLKGSRRHLRLDRRETLSLEPALSPEGLQGALTFDEWAVDARAFTRRLLDEGTVFGGAWRSGSKVVELQTRGGRVVEVRAIDADGSPRSVRPRVVVNATGPWAEQTARLAGCRGVRLILRKGVHLVVPGAPLRHALILPDASGRHIGLYPREGESWAGPTDDPYSGSPDDARGTVEEGEALRAALLRRLPGLESQGSPRTVAGLRPIVRSMMPGLLSRDYKVFDHAREGAANFLTVTGGKLTTYRPMAEETLHWVMLKLERPPAPEEIPEDLGTLTRALATHNRLLSFGLSLLLMAFFWLRHRARGAPATGGLDEFKRIYGRER